MAAAPAAAPRQRGGGRGVREAEAVQRGRALLALLLAVITSNPYRSLCITMTGAVYNTKGCLTSCPHPRSSAVSCEAKRAGPPPP